MERSRAPSNIEEPPKPIYRFYSHSWNEKAFQVPYISKSHKKWIFEIEYFRRTIQNRITLCYRIDLREDFQAE
jgi:hypothetical protein